MIKKKKLVELNAKITKLEGDLKKARTTADEQDSARLNLEAEKKKLEIAARDKGEKADKLTEELVKKDAELADSKKQYEELKKKVSALMSV